MSHLHWIDRKKFEVLYAVTPNPTRYGRVSNWKVCAICRRAKRAGHVQWPIEGSAWRWYRPAPRPVLK